jgi:predicted membrane protein
MLKEDDRMNRSGGNSGMFWGVILILFGILFILDNFYIIDFGDFIATYWPLILVAIGIKILLDHQRQKKDTDEFDTGEAVNTFGEPSNVDGISESNVFGDINLNITSDTFRGGSVSNIFGDIKLDISKATIPEGVTKIFVNGVFGDVTIVTPKDIPIRMSGSCVAGDIGVRGYKKDGIFTKLEHTEETYDTGKSKLSISVSIIFGSVTVF